MIMAQTAEIGGVIGSLVDLAELIYNSISSFFTGITYSFQVVLDFINSLPTIFSYGIKLSVSTMVVLLVVNTLKGMIA